MPKLNPLSLKGLRETLRRTFMEREDLLRKARPRKELIVAEEFIVDSVNHIDYKILIPTPSEIFGINTMYRQGTTDALEIKVNPINEILTRTLIFPGQSSVMGGNSIRAYIQRYD